MQLPSFKLEEYFAKHEFVAPYMMGSSDPETYSVRDILAMADTECAALWEKLTLSYTETQGFPLLRAEIAKMYDTLEKDNMLIFSGAEEAIYITMQKILQPNDEVVIMTPCYQSLKEIPKAVGAKIIEFALEWKNNQWHFNLEQFTKVVSNNTKLIVINFPHNPTGFQPNLALFQAIIDIAKRVDAYLFSDEVYRLSEQNAADCYHKAMSLGVMSKSFGLPGSC